MPRRKPAPNPTTAAPVSSYKHDSRRKRIPTQEESIKLPPRHKRPAKKSYAYDPALDPQLVWAGKQEQGTEFEVPTVPIYVQEKIAPEAIIARLKTGAHDERQMLLFGETAEDQYQKAVEFYQHEDNWQNRMILGDSLLVMNSLLEKEGMRGKVQTVYIDPPYGIKFSSNWQPSTRRRVVSNSVEDLVRQPEQVKAFRDTWELGIHSYLSYLRDRLIMARELLNESGSCFVQIGDENIHHLREIMDEVFGSANFVNLISFFKTGAQTSQVLAANCDYLLWYTKDKERLKIRKLYKEDGGWAARAPDQWEELPDGRRLRAKAQDGPVARDAKQFTHRSLESTTGSEASRFPFEFEERTFRPKRGWSTTPEGMKRLAAARRIIRIGEGIRFVTYLSDFPYSNLTTIWDDTGTGSFLEPNVYVVQTGLKIIQRCILMTTDPGDIVLDPTCGSGTSAYVAEQWGRRWITMDTSRVALALARTRLMTARYPFYQLRDEHRVSMGFQYHTVPHVGLKSLANNEEPEQEILYDKPFENKEIVRVAGPFTVESLSPHRVSDAQEMLNTDRYVHIVIDSLLRAGVQTGAKGARVEFVNLDVLASGPDVQAVGEYKTLEGLKKVAVAIGPEFGSVDDDFVRDAVAVAKRFASLLVVAAPSFEASAHSVPAELDGLRIMKVKINPDLSMGELLKKTRAANLFLAFGEPEIKVKQTKQGVVVEVLGVDVYDPVRGEIRSSGTGDPEHEIAAWFIDTNYNGEAFFVTHAYFLGSDKPYEKLKKALKADIDEEVWEQLYSTVSRPFPKPKTGKIAVKVINHYGDEVMTVAEA